MDQVLRVEDAAWDEQRVHFLLERLVALEEVSEVCQWRVRSKDEMKAKTVHRRRTEDEQAFTSSNFLLQVAKLMHSTATDPEAVSAILFSKADWLRKFFMVLH